MVNCSFLFLTCGQISCEGKKVGVSTLQLITRRGKENPAEESIPVVFPSILSVSNQLHRSDHSPDGNNLL